MPKLGGLGGGEMERERDSGETSSSSLCTPGSKISFIKSSDGSDSQIWVISDDDDDKEEIGEGVTEEGKSACHGVLILPTLILLGKTVKSCWR